MPKSRAGYARDSGGHQAGGCVPRKATLGNSHGASSTRRRQMCSKRGTKRETSQDSAAFDRALVRFSFRRIFFWAVATMPISQKNGAQDSRDDTDQISKLPKNAINPGTDAV